MDELKKCRKLKAGQKKPDDPSFRGASIPLEQNIETFIFPDMDKGQEILDMDFAHKLVADLEASGVTKPTFPRHVWDVSFLHSSLTMGHLFMFLNFQTIKMVVQPSPLDVANAQKSLKTKDANRTARNARRRQVYASKVAAQAKATMDEPESAGSDHDEDDPDEQEMDDIEDEQQQLPEGEGEDAPASHTGGAYNLPPLSRKDHVRGLFGSTSDISSTDSNDQDQDDVNVEIRDVCYIDQYHLKMQSNYVSLHEGWHHCLQSQGSHCRECREAWAFQRSCSARYRHTGHNQHLQGGK